MAWLTTKETIQNIVEVNITLMYFFGGHDFFAVDWEGDIGKLENMHTWLKTLIGLQNFPVAWSNGKKFPS